MSVITIVFGILWTMAGIMTLHMKIELWKIRRRNKDAQFYS